MVIMITLTMAINIIPMGTMVDTDITVVTIENSGKVTSGANTMVGANTMAEASIMMAAKQLTSDGIRPVYFVVPTLL